MADAADANDRERPRALVPPVRRLARGVTGVRIGWQINNVAAEEVAQVFNQM